MMQIRIDEIWWGRTFKNTSYFSFRFMTTWIRINFWIYDEFLDSRWIPGFTMGSWIHDVFLDSRWVPGFTMGSWIHDGFLDSRWVSGFTMVSWIHDGFLGSQLVPGFTMGSGKKWRSREARSLTSTVFEVWVFFLAQNGPRIFLPEIVPRPIRILYPCQRLTVHAAHPFIITLLVLV